MRVECKQASELDRLDDLLQSAHVITPDLFQLMTESAGERLSILRRAGKTGRMQSLLEAGACMDAALVLLEMEMPSWKVRRLVFDGDEWLCSLSRRPHAPIELDEPAEGRHASLPLAILRAMLDAHRLNLPELTFAPVNTLAGSGRPFCCDNFA